MDARQDDQILRRRPAAAILLRARLGRRGTRSPIFGTLRDPQLVPALAAILDAAGVPPTVGSLAMPGGTSRSVFAERFSATYSEAPIEYLHRARLQLAARLLTTSPMSIPVKAIAAGVGYASRSYFSHAFKAAYGQGPSTCRGRHIVAARSAEPMPDATFSIEPPMGEIY